MNSLDDLFTITCGKCHKESPVTLWGHTVTGPLPAGHFQCPHCHWAFTRARNPEHAAKPWQKPIMLADVHPRL